MFKKIRNKILLLNMVMVSSVVIVAFATIFATTYARIRSENRQKLRFGLPMQPMTISGEPLRQEAYVHVEPEQGGAFVSGFTTRISPDAGFSFSLLVDSQMDVVVINSMVDLLPETYTQAAAQAMKDSDGAGVIVLEGRTWQYAISPVAISFKGADVHADGAAALQELSNIRFLDVTDSYRMIRSLALMLAGSILAVLTVFFFISRYFAGQAIKPMEEAWEKQSRFITDASHELKTPLTVINANCGVLYAGKEETVESQLKWVDSIARAADRMTGLVNSLLSLVSIEDNQLVLENILFDLSQAVTDAADEIEAAADKRGLTIHKEIDSGVEITSDREHVQKVLSILLDNALKYTDSGGVLTVSLKKDKRRVTCAVRNSGEGISPENLPHLFDRFYRTDPARSSQSGGYGLGLSIAKAIANQLGASLSVDSTLGEYTEFRLIFEA